jgi:hypothetical protein
MTSSVFIAFLLANDLLFPLPTKIPADHTLKELLRLKIIIGSVSYNSIEPEKSELFGEYGEVIVPHRVTGRYAGKPKRFLFVEISKQWKH